MVKHVRILSTGKIAPGDRRVHTSKNAPGGADRVHWQVVEPGTKFVIHFKYSKGSPFARGEKQSFKVPGTGAQEVNGELGRYKYAVESHTGKVLDDPDVIIE